MANGTTNFAFRKIAEIAIAKFEAEGFQIVTWGTWTRPQTMLFEVHHCGHRVAHLSTIGAKCDICGYRKSVILSRREMGMFFILEAGNLRRIR